MKRTSFLGVSSRRFCRSSQNHSALLKGKQRTNWIHTEWTESLDRWFMSKSVNKDDSRVSNSSCFRQVKNQVGIAYCPHRKKKKDYHLIIAMLSN